MLPALPLCSQVEGVQSAADAEVIELADDEEKERLAKDPLYRWVLVLVRGGAGAALQLQHAHLHGWWWEGTCTVPGGRSSCTVTALYGLLAVATPQGYMPMQNKGQVLLSQTTLPGYTTEC